MLILHSGRQYGPSTSWQRHDHGAREISVKKGTAESVRKLANWIRVTTRPDAGVSRAVETPRVPDCMVRICNLGEVLGVACSTSQKMPAVSASRPSSWNKGSGTQTLTGCGRHWQSRSRPSFMYGMSSPPPSAAQVLERAIVELSVHEQRDLNLRGQHYRTNSFQE
jgi:hypothetical protein